MNRLGWIVKNNKENGRGYPAHAGWLPRSEQKPPQKKPKSDSPKDKI